MAPPSQNSLSAGKKFGFILILYFLLFALGAVLIGGSVIVIRSHRLYAYYKNKESSVEGKVFSFDPLLGSAPIPGAQGWLTYPDGSRIPVRFDRNGFRAPLNEPDADLARKPSLPEIETLNSLPRAVIVNTEPALLKALPVKTKAVYDLTYRTYRGNPPVLIDAHPNARAHRIMADEIVKALAPSK